MTARSSALKAKSALVAQRRETALRLKRSGKDNITIGRFLAADPVIREPQVLDPETSEPVGYPEGYGADRYAKGSEPPSDHELSRMVSQDISRALKDRAKALADAADEMRALEQERLEAMWPGVWPAASTGDPVAITAALKIMDRRAKLLGLDASFRLEVSGRDGGPVEVRNYTDSELARLADALAAGDPVSLDDPDTEPDLG